MDADILSGLNKFLNARERDINTFHVEALVCSGGPLDGKTIELTAPDAQAAENLHHCADHMKTAVFTLGGMTGHYQKFIGSTKENGSGCAAVWVEEGKAAPTTARVQKNTPQAKAAPKACALGRGFSMLSELMSAMACEPKTVEHAGTVFALFSIGRASYRVLNTPEAIERLRCAVLKRKKWFSDKVLNAPKAAPIQAEPQDRSDIQARAAKDVADLVANATATTDNTQDQAAALEYLQAMAAENAAPVAQEATATHAEDQHQAAELATVGATVCEGAQAHTTHQGAPSMGTTIAGAGHTSAPVIYCGKSIELPAAQNLLTNIRAAIREDSQEIDTARKSKKAGAAEIINTLELRRRARTDIAHKLQEAIAGAIHAANTTNQAQQNQAAPTVDNSSPAGDAAPISAPAQAADYTDPRETLGGDQLHDTPRDLETAPEVNQDDKESETSAGDQAEDDNADETTEDNADEGADYVGRGTYSPEDNKLRLHPFARLATEVYARIKAAGFIWAAKQGFFVAPAWSPARADILEALTGDIEDEDSTMAERAAARADRFDDYQGKRSAEAVRAVDQVHAIGARFDFGQPILIGHHSERRARRDKQKMDDGMRKAVRLWDTASYWQNRAAAAVAHAAYMERPDVRARRIKTLEAEQRKCQREHKDAAKMHDFYTNPETAQLKTRDGRNMRAALLNTYEGGLNSENRSALEAGTLDHEKALHMATTSHARTMAHYARWVNHLGNRIAYERAMLGESGGTAADQVKPEVGGAVKSLWAPRGGWAIIHKVNKISVTLMHSWNEGGRVFRHLEPMDKLRAVMTRSQVDQARAEGRIISEDVRGFRLLDAPAPAGDKPTESAPVLAAVDNSKPVGDAAPISDPTQAADYTNPRETLGGAQLHQGPQDPAPAPKTAPPFTKMAPVAVSLASVLGRGAPCTGLVGFGVDYLGDGATLPAPCVVQGAIVAARACPAHGAMVDIALEDGTQHSALPGSAFGPGGRWRLNLKNHGAPYLAQLASAKAQRSGGAIMAATNTTHPRETLPTMTPTPTPTNPDTMTGAELQTLREACGLEREEFAALADVQARTLKHWENGRAGVPADVAQLARELDAATTQGAAALLQKVRFEVAGLGEGQPIVLTRYKRTEDMPAGNTMPAALHAAMLGRVRLELARAGLGRPVRVVWFDADQADDAARLAAQATPHKGDQPPSA